MFGEGLDLAGFPPALTRIFLGLPLLHGGPIKHIPHAGCLLLKELAVLSAFLSPGRVERRRVLVHQVGVLGATRPAKVFHLVGVKTVRK